MNDPKVQHKQRGDHDYYKITGNDTELKQISRRTREPVKEQEGINPRHVDVPARKIGWVRIENYQEEKE